MPINKPYQSAKFYRDYLWAMALLFLCSTNGFAADFTTNFESTNFNTVQDFTATNNGLTATFSGGTSFTIGNGALYHSGTKSWMLDPAGTTSRGVSTGEGTITFSQSAVSLDFYIRTSNANSTGQIQIIDTTGAVIEDITSTIVNGSWLHVEKELNDGDPLMASVIVNAFGDNMLAIDDLSFSTPSTTENTEDGETENAEQNTETEPADENNEETAETGGIDAGDSDSSSSGGTLYWLLLMMAGILKRKQTF